MRKERQNKPVYSLLAIAMVFTTMVSTACGGDDKDSDTNASTEAIAGNGGTSVALTVESTVGEIMADPNGEVVLRACFSDEGVDNPRFAEMYNMNLPTVAPMSNGQISDEVVTCVDNGLQALKGGRLNEWLASNPSPTTVAAPAENTTASNTASVPEGHKGSITIDSLLADLLANPSVEALLRECFGELMDNPAIEGVAPSYSLPELEEMSPNITPEKLQCVVDGLEAMPE